MVKYLLPKLSFDYDSLEPFIDKDTMFIHHQKHHQSYVDGLNRCLEKFGGSGHPQYISSILSDLQSVPSEFQNELNFFGGGYENHRLFWDTLSPDPKTSPDGKLSDAIDVYFQNFENFKSVFTLNSIGLQGSGWCWLVFNSTYNRIEIMTTENQTSPWTYQKTPLLGLDLWEHAYYLKYQNKKAQYIENWWNVINWEYVENRFSELSP